MAVVERESSHSDNKPPTGYTCPDTKHRKNDENIKIFGKASLLTLTNDPFVLDHP